MSYLLRMMSFDENKRYDIGIFESEDSIKNFLKEIEFLKIDSYSFDGFSYEDYYIYLSDLPDYYEIEYKDFKFILSTYMFDNLEAGNKIDFIWDEIHLWDKAEQTDASKPSQFIYGATKVDAYIIPNEETEEYILARNQLVAEAEEHFSQSGILLERSYRGSEDGEALTSYDPKTEEGHFLFHLDPYTIERRKEYPSFLEFLQDFN